MWKIFLFLGGPAVRGDHFNLIHFLFSILFSDAIQFGLDLLFQDLLNIPYSPSFSLSYFPIQQSFSNFFYLLVNCVTTWKFMTFYEYTIRRKWTWCNRVIGIQTWVVSLTPIRNKLNKWYIQGDPYTQRVKIFFRWRCSVLQVFWCSWSSWACCWSWNCGQQSPTHVKLDAICCSFYTNNICDLDGFRRGSKRPII